MGKNDKLINSLKKVAKRNQAVNVVIASNDIVPQMYAAMAIALKQEFNFGYERINRVFKRSQDLWEGLAAEGLGAKEMAKMCQELTGIKVMGDFGEKNASKL